MPIVSVEPALLLTLLDGFFGGIGPGQRRSAGRHRAGRAAISRSDAAQLRGGSGRRLGAVSPVELELVKQETNPRLVQLGGALESVVVARFTVEFAARSGRIDWLLPDALLSAHPRGAGRRRRRKRRCASRKPGRPCSPGRCKRRELDTRAILAQAQISLRELVRLSPGDIIPIEAPQQVTLLAGDVPLYRGRFGISQGRNALKILPGAPA